MSTSFYCFALVALLVGLDTLGQSYGQLPAKNAIEGDCLPLETEGQPEAMKLAFVHKETWFIHTAHRYFYRKYVEIFLGRPAADLTEFRQLKLQGKSMPGGFALLGFGNKEFHVGCVPTAFQANNTQIPLVITCNVTGGSPGINMKAMEPITGQMLWSDGKCILVGTLCIHGHRAFAVWSIDPVLPEATMNMIYAKLIQKGFDKDFFEHLTY